MRSKQYFTSIKNNPHEISTDPFSPVFTILSKLYLPLFTFDATGICFTIVSVVFVICGCFGVTYIFDRLHISPYFLGKKQMLPPYSSAH